MPSVSEPASHSFFAALIIIAAGLGGILYGYDIGVISGAIVFMQKSIVMTTQEMGIIVGAVLSGGLVGTLITGPLADRFGRRTMILLACLIFACGLAAILVSESFISLLLGRLLLGVGIGVIAVASPLYIAEIAPAHIRGRGVTIFQLLLTFGILLAYGIDLLFTGSGNWHAMFAVIFVPVSLLFFSMLFLPETPRFLMAKGNKEKARTVLLKTRSLEEAEMELRQIDTNLQQTQSSWRALFVRSLWLPLFAALSIAILNQLTGINALLQYAPLVISQAGLHSQMGSMLGTIGIGLVNFLGTILSFFLVDRFGRRILLLIGTAGIIIAYSYLGALPHFVAQGELQAVLALIGLVTYIFFYAIGPGVVVWLAMSELLPTKVRGKALALALFLNSLASALLSTIFLNIENALGMSNTYWLFASFTMLYFLVALFFLPETKNKTLEEIQMFYQRRSKNVAI